MRPLRRPDTDSDFKQSPAPDIWTLVAVDAFSVDLVEKVLPRGVGVSASRQRLMYREFSVSSCRGKTCARQANRIWSRSAETRKLPTSGLAAIRSRKLATKFFQCSR